MSTWAFEVRRLQPDDRYESATETSELALVLLSGLCDVHSSRGAWQNIGHRRHVFDGLPWALYLPLSTNFAISTGPGCEIALCYARAEEPFPPRLIPPAEVDIEIRGAGNVTRRIHHILKPDFPAHRILVVEVYTPGGNWSSYPPHKHDVHDPPREADLDEIYYYRIDNPAGFAIQKLYTADRRLDETLTVRDGELILVPESYHPVVAAPGYNVYYLNALAGSARSMAATDDPGRAPAPIVVISFAGLLARFWRLFWRHSDGDRPVAGGGDASSAPQQEHADIYCPELSKAQLRAIDRRNYSPSDTVPMDAPSTGLGS